MTRGLQNMMRKKRTTSKCDHHDTSVWTLLQKEELICVNTPVLPQIYLSESSRNIRSLYNTTLFTTMSVMQSKQFVPCHCATLRGTMAQVNSSIYSLV
jgi:hypothetical protein